MGGGEGGTPLLHGLYGNVPLDAVTIYSLKSVLNRVYSLLRDTVDLICLIKFVCAPVCKSNDYDVKFSQLQMPINDFKTKQRSFWRLCRLS